MCLYDPRQRGLRRLLFGGARSDHDRFLGGLRMALEPREVATGDVLHVRDHQFVAFPFLRGTVARSIVQLFTARYVSGDVHDRGVGAG